MSDTRASSRPPSRWADGAAYEGWSSCSTDDSARTETTKHEKARHLVTTPVFAHRTVQVGRPRHSVRTVCESSVSI